MKLEVSGPRLHQTKKGPARKRWAFFGLVDRVAVISLSRGSPSRDGGCVKNAGAIFDRPPGMGGVPEWSGLGNAPAGPADRHPWRPTIQAQLPPRPNRAPSVIEA